MLDWSQEACYKYTFPRLRDVVENGGHGAPDIIWTTAPGSSALKEIFPNAKLIFHVVDYYPAFRGDVIKRVERRDYLAADHIFSIGGAISDYLMTELEVPKGKITTLGQGVSLARYGEGGDNPEAMKSMKHPIGVYVGVVKKIDRLLLASVAQKLEEYGSGLIVIGPKADWAGSFQDDYPRTKFLGPKHPSEVSAYLNNADFGLMLYDRSKPSVYRGQNPLKLYEYAAAGLPVLSTPHYEYEFLCPPVKIITSEEQIDQAVETVLGDWKQLSEKMKLFAAKHTWASCVDRAQEVIEKLTKP